MMQPIIDLLIWLSITLGSLGWAIIVFTLVIKIVLYPINKSSIKSALKLKTLAPELEKLKKKFSKKPQKLQQAQMELYKKSGVNPLGGCLPQLIQLAVVIVLYRSLISLLGQSVIEDGTIATGFLWLDLRVSDPLYILPVIAAVSQFLVSQLMMGTKPEPKKKKSAKPSSPKPENSMMAMQKQMIYVMPIMTGVIAASFPSGVALYWVASTLFSLFQQWSLMTKSQRSVALETLTSLPSSIRQKINI